MYINGVEEDSDILMDNDADTCVNLTGSDGYKVERVKDLLLLFCFQWTVCGISS